MAYLTPTELIARFDQDEVDELVGQLDQATADAKIAAAIADAEAEVNSALSVRYTIPVADSSLLKRIVGDIARFLLHDNLATAEVRERYEDRVKLLDQIASGKRGLAGSTSDAVVGVASDTGGVLVSSPISQLGLDRY